MCVLGLQEDQLLRNTGVCLPGRHIFFPFLVFFINFRLSLTLYVYTVSCRNYDCFTFIRLLTVLS